MCFLSKEIELHKRVVDWNTPLLHIFRLAVRSTAARHRHLHSQLLPVVT